MNAEFSPASTLLLVIDMQEGFMKPHMATLPDRIATFIKKWEAQGGQTLFTTYRNYPGSPCEKYLQWSAMQSPPETDLCHRLQKYAKTIVEKTIYTALISEAQELIEKQGYETILCCGTDTAACIQKTALDIFDLNRRPIVLADLCDSGAGKEAHEAALIALRRGIGEQQVVESNQVVA